MATETAIDQVIEQALRLRPDCDPGVRMVAGKPWTYDQDLLLSYWAREALRRAPADLSNLSKETLLGLASAARRRWFDTKGAEGQDQHQRVLSELKRRNATPAKAA